MLKIQSNRDLVILLRGNIVSNKNNLSLKRV